MNNSTPIRILFTLLTLSIGIIGQAMAQAEPDPLISNNGAMFYINGGINSQAVVWVDGTVANNDSIMVNLGQFIIHGDFINNAQCGGDGTFPLQLSGNNGTFELYGDWENNGVYHAGDGLVKFMTTDSIQGTEVTRFHDVELVGGIRRIQDQIDSEIDASGTIDLDAGEWATDFNILWVHNPNTGAMIRETNCDPCGFVSSLEDGNLARVTAQAANYNFPTGSSLDVSPNQDPRYRPITIRPESNAVDTFHVRFVNRNASINSLPVTDHDTTICYVNPWWYHRINQSGGANATANIAIYANAWEGDHDYNTIANWNSTVALWENVNNCATGTVDQFEQTLRNNWDDFQTGYPDDAYILGFEVPPPPVVDGDTALCASVPVTYTLPNNGSDYDIIVDTNGVVIDQTNNSVTVIWNNDDLNSIVGTITVVETIPNNVNGGCASITRVFPVEIYALPIADFTIGLQDTTQPGGIFIHDILEVVNNSINATEWNWDFGDGVTSIDSMPYHSYYDIGTYDVQLIVRSGLDCLDTLVVPVDVVEGLIVPNVFTPNNDGWNDVFDVRTSDVGAFNLEIYNRWGNVVFENSSPLISWDGTTMAGVQAPAGTYFYVISKAEMNSGNAINNELPNYNFKETGWVTLLR